ncbi:hypothetical protein NPIL_642621, partial [Nephila pilipes]
MSARTLY